MNRREERLIGVHPALVSVIRAAWETGPDFMIVEGLRTAERQKTLVATGKSQTMNSMHLPQPDGYGHAVDVLSASGKWTIEDTRPVLIAINKAAEKLGVKLRFGINWKSDPTLPIQTKFVDAFHVELAATDRSLVK